eukprot:1419063-Rhodomonas_salina.3
MLPGAEARGGSDEHDRAAPQLAPAQGGARHRLRRRARRSRSQDPGAGRGTGRARPRERGAGRGRRVVSAVRGAKRVYCAQSSNELDGV